MTRLVEIAVPDEVRERACAGEEGARQLIYAEVAPATFALIRRLVGNRSAAEDVFQDTMMILFERLREFRQEAPLGAWLRQIAISRCLMHLRKHSSLEEIPYPCRGRGVLRSNKRSDPDNRGWYVFE